MPGFIWAGIGLELIKRLLLECRKPATVDINDLAGDEI